MLRKLLQEYRPYEAVRGEARRVYDEHLDRVVRATEAGGRELASVVSSAAAAFRAIELREGPRKPVVAVVGEIFMRDNPFCSGFLVDRLEALGAETLIAPAREWLLYSTLRYERDCRWEGDLLGVVRAKLQEFFSHVFLGPVERAVRGAVQPGRDIRVEEMLERCMPYVHRDYDGDPAIALGSAAALAESGISGVAAILPFSCLPGTIVASVSGSFRADHDNMPWINVDYDGQEDSAMEVRLQAFMHQAREYAARHEPAGGLVASVASELSSSLSQR
jgi:predicted nucleotide-binding protein (sugar kinase/HSP70/actin superfamily)